MYLIVPAATDQAGRCNIVFKAGFDGEALKDYRQNPGAWQTVGHMNSRGELVALDAPVSIFQALKSFEPLMAGICIPKHDLEVDAFTADLGYTHPAKSLLAGLTDSTPFTMLYQHTDGDARLAYCETTGSTPQKTQAGDYRIGVRVHHVNDGNDHTSTHDLDISSDGSCKLIIDGQPQPARPIVVGFATSLTKSDVRDEQAAALNSMMGRIWWVANDEQELMTDLDRLSRAGAHLCSLERESESVIHYSFALNKEHAKAIMLYEPDAEEWLEHDVRGILPHLEASLKTDFLAEASKPVHTPERNR